MYLFRSAFKNYWMISLVLIFSFLTSQNLHSQTLKVGGLITIGEVNSPGVGGISIAIKGTSITTVSDNDGEYRIYIPDNKTVLIFSYPGMITQEIIVGSRSRIDVDLLKIPSEKVRNVHATSICIVLPKNASEIEQNVARVLKDRLQSNSNVKISISNEKDPSKSLNIFLRLAARSGKLHELGKNFNLRLPGIEKPFAEGYTVKTVTLDNSPAILAIGADNRGVLYAAGEILR